MFFLILSTVTLEGNCDIPHIFWINDILNLGYKDVDFITLNIENHESQNIQCYLTIKLLKGNLEIVSGKTEVFTLYQYEKLTLTPSSFNSDRFKLKEIYLNESIDTLRRILLSTGKLPTGNYILRFEFTRIGSASSEAFWECPFEIVNEHGIEALSPGVPFGAPLVSTNETPVFLWSGRCDSFRITIGMIVNFSLSPDELLDKYKILEKDFPKNTYLFSYPREFPPLTSGYYIWRVTGFLKTSRGLEKIYSAPLCFKIDEFDDEEIIKILIKKMGNNEVINEIKNKKFRATGNITLDSHPLTIEEFKRLILKQNVKIKDVRLR